MAHLGWNIEGKSVLICHDQREDGLQYECQKCVEAEDEAVALVIHLQSQLGTAETARQAQTAIPNVSTTRAHVLARERHDSNWRVCTR